MKSEIPARTHIAADDLAVTQARLERLDVKDNVTAGFINDAIELVELAIQKLNRATQRGVALVQQEERQAKDLVGRLEASIAAQKCEEVGRQ